MWVFVAGLRAGLKDEARLVGALQLRHDRVEVAFGRQLLCAQRSHSHFSHCRYH